MKIAMLSTGEEVLHGDIVDTNAAWLSRYFYQHGLSLSKRSTVGDQMGALVEEMLMLSFNNDVVIVNGGLGPTTDDLSAAAAAKATDSKLVLFKEWLAVLEAWYTKRGKPMPDSNLKQAMLPEQSSIIPNPIGTACGFKLEINDAVFYFTPGVPSEFKRMIEEQIVPDLLNTHPEIQPAECSKIFTCGLSESVISDVLDPMKLPQGYELGYRSYLPFIEVKLFGPKGQLEERVRLMQLIYSHLESHVVSVDEDMLSHIGHLLGEKQLTLAVAEQDSHGYLSQWLRSNELVDAQCGASWILGNQQPVPDEGDVLAATFALAGATREKCNTDLSLVTGKLAENQFSVALSSIAGEWGMVLSLSRNYSREGRDKAISAVAADLLRRYLERKPMFTSYSFAAKERELFIPASVIST